MKKSRFGDFLEYHFDYLKEAAAPPPAPAAGGDAPPLPPPEAGATGAGGDAGGGSALPGMGGDMPGMDGDGEPPKAAMDNKAKRDTDPIAYTRAWMKMLVDSDEGITPEMFSDFLDTYGTGLNELKDKAGFKTYYATFHKRIQSVMEIGEELKKMYSKLHKEIKGTLSNQSEDPNNAKGGKGKAGPAGPGVGTSQGT